MLPILLKVFSKTWSQRTHHSRNYRVMKNLQKDIENLQRKGSPKLPPAHNVPTSTRSVIPSFYVLRLLACYVYGPVHCCQVDHCAFCPYGCRDMICELDSWLECRYGPVRRVRRDLAGGEDWHWQIDVPIS